MGVQTAVRRMIAKRILADLRNPLMQMEPDELREAFKVRYACLNLPWAA